MFRAASRVCFDYIFALHCVSPKVCKGYIVLRLGFQWNSLRRVMLTGLCCLKLKLFWKFFCERHEIMSVHLKQLLTGLWKRGCIFHILMHTYHKYHKKEEGYILQWLLRHCPLVIVSFHQESYTKNVDDLQFPEVIAQGPMHSNENGVQQTFQEVPNKKRINTRGLGGW